MLLEFKVSNYKSFKDEMVFSMVPAPKQKGLDYSILQETIQKKGYKALCSAVIYGPNASGKTNIIGAMDTFRSIVLRGHIRNDENASANIAASRLELIPNNQNTESEPVRFSIKFTVDGYLIDYAFSADLGTFLSTNYARTILEEQLSVNQSVIFSRDQKHGLEIGELTPIKALLANGFEENAEGAVALASGNLNGEELFLLNGFKTMFSAKLVSLIADWFETKLQVVYRADSIELFRKVNDAQQSPVYVERAINLAARRFGINSNALAFIARKDSNEAELCSVFQNGKAIPAKLFESYGTVRFVNIFPLIAHALLTGGTLVVDEFDASLHPMALMSLINIFHNDEINIHHAQLIFDTHNPIFLNANLFRRDEIHFVDRDEDTHCSSHYTLADFGTAGAAGVRKNEDYMKNYFVDRYGAIKDVDFTPIFQNMIQQGKEAQNESEKSNA